MDYSQNGDGSIFWKLALDGGHWLILRAHNIRQERHRVYSRLSVHIDERMLGWTTDNIEENSKRVNLAGEAYRALEEIEKGICTRERLKHALDVFCDGLWDAYIQTEPVKEYGIDEVKHTEKWLLKPFIPNNLPGAIFGDGGLGKSLIAQAISVCVQLNYPGFGFRPERQANVAYFDWETSWEFWADRLQAMEEGMELDTVPHIFYDHPRRHLADDISRIQRLIDDHNIEFIVIDSAALACGGNVQNEERVLEFFAALDHLGSGTKLSTLIIGHTSKAEEGKKTMYGNVFWQNSCRSVWEIRKAEDIGRDAMSIGLFHRKCNIDKLQDGRAYNINFDEEQGIRIKPQNVADVVEFAPERPLWQRILEELKDGDMTQEQIASNLRISANTVKSRLYELQRKNKVVKLDKERWGLAWES